MCWERKHCLKRHSWSQKALPRAVLSLSYASCLSSLSSLLSFWPPYWVQSGQPMFLATVVFKCQHQKLVLDERPGTLSKIGNSGWLVGWLSITHNWKRASACWSLSLTPRGKPLFSSQWRQSAGGLPSGERLGNLIDWWEFLSIAEM